MTPADSNATPPADQHSRLLALFLPAFLLCYFALGVARMGKNEYYPIASWAMFSTVPNEVTTYRLRVTGIGSRSITPPAYYGSAQAVLTAPVKVSTVFAIRRLGKALAVHETQLAAQLRTVVERAVLPAGATYDIVEQRYWPIEKWLHNRYSESVVASFRAEAGAQ
jgi:hypothetical protein